MAGSNKIVQSIVLKVGIDDSGLTTKINKISKSTEKAKQSLDGMSDALKKSGSTAKNEGMGFKKFTKGVSDLDKELGKIRRHNKTLTGLRNQIKQTEKSVVSTTKSTNLMSQAFGAIGTSVILGKLQQLGQEAINISREFERASIVSQTAFGDQAGAQMAFAAQEADRLGLNLLKTSKEYAKFSAAAIGSGMSIEESKDIYTAAAEASAALALSTEDQAGVLRALTQISSKGVVSSEELRQQLGDRLPQAFALASDAMGVSTAELNKMLEQGEVLSKDFLPKFADQLRNAFHEGAMKNANSEIAQSTRNLNRYNEQMRLAGDELKVITTGAGAAALSLWEGMTDSIADLIVKGAELTGNLDGVIGAQNKLKVSSGGAKTKTDELTESQKKLAESAKKAKVAQESLYAVMQKAGLDQHQAEQIDKVRIALGLSEKGFGKISGTVTEAMKTGASFNDVLEASRQILDGVKLEKGDLIKDEEIEKAKKLKKELDKMGLELFFGKSGGLVPKSGIYEGPKENPDKQKEEKKTTKKEESRGVSPITEALDAGSAEAKSFLARPADKIQSEQLEQQKQIARNTAKAANSTVTLVAGSTK